MHFLKTSAARQQIRLCFSKRKQNPRIPFTREGASQNQRSTFADSFYTSLNYPYEKLSPKPQDFGGHVGLHCTSRNYKAHREIF